MSQTAIQYSVCHGWYFSDFFFSPSCLWQRQYTIVWLCYVRSSCYTITHTHRHLGCMGCKYTTETRSFSLWRVKAMFGCPRTSKQAVTIALLCAGDRSPETVVTGTCSCYCIYFRVKQLYMYIYCFVLKRTRICIVLAAFSTLFWQVFGQPCFLHVKLFLQMLFWPGHPPFVQRMLV